MYCVAVDFEFPPPGVAVSVGYLTYFPMYHLFPSTLPNHTNTLGDFCARWSQILCKLRLFKNQRCVDCVVVHPRLCERLLLVTRTLSRAHQTNCRVRVQAFVQASSIMIYTTGDELYLNNIESTLFSVCNVKDVVETV